MIPIIFNAYPSPIKDINDVVDIVSLCADKLRYMKNKVELEGYVGLDDESFNKWVINKDGSLCLTIPQLLYNFKKEKREKIRFLISIFGKGKVIPECENDELPLSVLKHIEAPAPSILFAQKKDGVTLSISDDDDWNINFFELQKSIIKILNIHHSASDGIIDEWIDSWRKRHLDFIERLQQKFNLIFCPGATNDLPSEVYYDDIEKLLTCASDSGYQVNNNTIKSITQKDLTFLELRNVSSGLRIFMSLIDHRPYIGGFYIKSQAMDQNKTIKKAAKRLAQIK